MNRILWAAFWASVIAFGLSSSKSFGASDSVMTDHAAWYEMDTQTTSVERFSHLT